jgi:hypothetical protein
LAGRVALYYGDTKLQVEALLGRARG